MARKSSVTRAAKSGLTFMVRRIMKLVGLAKEKASGKSWSRLHRIESELATVEGKKNALKRNMVKALAPKRAGLKR